MRRNGSGSQQFRAFSGTWLITHSPRAVIVNEGFTLRLTGTIEPSVM
jgi:hypothetical protein